MADSQLENLMSMGYTREKAIEALDVAGGDMEQAVGFLLMGGFEVPPSIDDGGNNSSRYHLKKLSTGDEDHLEELKQMGYDENHARRALQAAGGDLGQAINFLLMGESAAGFIVEPDSSFRITEAQTDSDLGLAAALQVQELNNKQPSPGAAAVPFASAQAVPARASAMYFGNALPVTPKMVASKSFLQNEEQAPFCACVAAAKFLSGGVVTSDFLNSIMEDGIELFRKTSGNNAPYTVEKVLKKFGKNLGIETVIRGDVEPKKGIHVEHDLEHTLGVRKQLALCRNEQQFGWHVVIMAIDPLDYICICLPPKGSKNKFWYFDFVPRTQFGVPGAYARVHNTLVQLDEALESIISTNLQKISKGHEAFVFYTIKKSK